MTFFKRRDLLCRLPLTCSQKLVLLRLHDFCGRKNKAFPSQGRLSDDVSLSVRQLRRVLKELSAAGLLMTKRRQRLASVHVINWEVVEHRAVKRTSASHQKPSSDRTSMSHQEQPLTGRQCPIKENLDRTSTSGRPDICDTFDRTPMSDLTQPERNLNSTGTGAPDVFKESSKPARKTSIARAPKLKPADFSELARGIEVIDGLVMAGNLTRGERLPALSLWCRIGRTLATEPEKLTSPSGVFFHAVRDHEFKIGDGDEIAAEKFLKAHDRSAADARPVNPLVAAMAQQKRIEPAPLIEMDDPIV